MKKIPCYAYPRRDTRKFREERGERKFSEKNNYGVLSFLIFTIRAVFN